MILAVNPGSTSLKIAVYQEKECVVEENLKIDMTDIIQKFQTYSMDGDSALMRLIYDFNDEVQMDLRALDIVVARGGPSPPTKSGAYAINDVLLNTYRYSPRAKHASMVGPAIAAEIAGPLGIPAIVYDFDVMDEADLTAHLTGLPELERNMSSHALNGRMVARLIAEERGRAYEEMNFVIAHIGGGVSICAHRKGKIIDSVFVEEGPMAPTRAGRLPTRGLIDLCFSGKYTRDEMQEFVMMTGGLMAHLGTSDAVEVEQRIERGDHYAKDVYYGMSYQISKCIAEMSAALCGKVDAVILTGGISHSKMLTGWIAERIGYLGPIHLFPGGDEMRALALGGLRVLDKVEQPNVYDVVPDGFASLEQFYEAFRLPMPVRL